MSKTNEKNNQGASHKKAFICIAIGLLIGIIYGAITSSGGGGSDSSEAVRNISSDLKSNPTQLSNIIFTLSDFQINGSGKVLKTDCKIIESDGKGRYLVQCDVRYNPKDRNNNTDVTKENTVTVMAVFINNGNGTFSKKYERKAYTSSLKTSSCWGKDKSYGLKCQ